MLWAPNCADSGTAPVRDLGRGRGPRSCRGGVPPAGMRPATRTHRGHARTASGRLSRPLPRLQSQRGRVHRCSRADCWGPARAAPLRPLQHLLHPLEMRLVRLQRQEVEDPLQRAQPPEGKHAVLDRQPGSGSFGFEAVCPRAFQRTGGRVGDPSVRDEFGENVEPLERDPRYLRVPRVMGSQALLCEMDVLEGDTCSGATSLFQASRSARSYASTVRRAASRSAYNLSWAGLPTLPGSRPLRAASVAAARSATLAASDQGHGPGLTRRFRGGPWEAHVTLSQRPAPHNAHTPTPRTRSLPT